MKIKYPLLGIIFWICTHGFSQSNELLNNQVDPRQYITIYELGKKGTPPVVIWSLDMFPDTLSQVKQGSENSKNHYLPVQKYDFIDKKASVYIKFKADLLAENIHFFGNISLKATLGGNDIEVNPWSMIGKEQRSYGVNNVPIIEIAQNFYSFFYQVDEILKEEARFKSIIGLNDFYAQWNRGEFAIRFLEKYNTIKSDINWLKRELITDTSKVPLNTSFHQILSRSEINKNDSLYNIILSNSLTDHPSLRAPFPISSLKISPLSRKRLINDYNEDLIRKYSFLLAINRRDFNPSFWPKVPLFDSYFNNDNIQENFKRADKLFHAIDSLAARSITEINSIISPDLLYSYNESLKEPVYNFDLISQIPGNRNASIKDSTILSRENYLDIRSKLLLSMDYINYFIASGSESMQAFLSISHMTVQEFKSISDELQKLIARLPEVNDISEIANSSERRNSLIRIYDIMKILKTKKSIIDQDLDSGPTHTRNQSEIINDIATRAGKMIFSKMLAAQIDLEKASAKDGDILEIKVIWKNIDSRALSSFLNSKSGDDFIELTTAKFHVKTMGWNLDNSQSAFLVKRINDHLANPETLSPSNYKPTGGVTLLWSYYNDHRYKPKWVNRQLKKLEPSFGLNVSYADFIKSNFEIGVGPVIGFWNNKVFLSMGYNLMVGGDSPFYIGLGFDFLNIYQAIKNNIVQNP